MTAVALRLPRFVLRLLLAALALKAWHLLLLRQDLDRPAIVAAWFLALFVTWIAAFRPSRATFWAGLSFLVLVFAFHWGYERAASDGREYFVQVRSLVFDRDLDFTNENATFGSRGNAQIYPFGAALLWAPFMIAAHIWLKLLNLFGGAYSTDGFTFPYQMAIGLGTLVYGFAGLVLVWRILRDYFGEAIASLATVATTAGTFFLWYLIVENSMVHGASMFATTLLIYTWYRGRRFRTTGASPAADSEAPRLAWWIALGLAGALTAMVRWQNVTFFGLAVLISIVELTLTKTDTGSRFRGVDRSLLRGLVAAAAAFVVGFLPQLIFWKVVRGGWFAIPSSEHSFDLHAYHAGDVLFSANHGLLAATPLVSAALIGLPFFVRRGRALAILLIAGFVSQVIVNAGPEGWWGGAGFGARRFDNCMIVFAVGLAGLLAWLRTRPLVAPMTAIAVLIALNLGVMADVRHGRLPAGEAINFTDMMQSVSRRAGNVFSFPYNLYVSWRFDTDFEFYDRLNGRSFNNLEIDFGDDGDELLLGHGWFDRERNDTLTYRWATGAVSSVVVPLRSGDRYRIDIACDAFRFPGAPPQVLTVDVNRREVASITLRPGLQTYTIDLAAGVLHPNLNLIQFRYAYSKSPAEAGLSADSRSLAVLFDSLKLRRLMGDLP